MLWRWGGLGDASPSLGHLLYPLDSASHPAELQPPRGSELSSGVLLPAPPAPEEGCFWSLVSPPATVLSRGWAWSETRVSSRPTGETTLAEGTAGGQKSNSSNRTLGGVGVVIREGTRGTSTSSSRGRDSSHKITEAWTSDNQEEKGALQRTALQSLEGPEWSGPGSQS